jgi:hypothetical protein
VEEKEKNVFVAKVSKNAKKNDKLKLENNS